MSLFKQGAKVCVLFMALLLLAVSAVAQDEIPVVTNGGFENANLGKIKKKESLEGWELITGKVAKSHFYIVEDLDNPNEQALKIKVRKPGRTPWSIRAVQENIQATPGVEYQFTAKVAGPEGTRAAFIVQSQNHTELGGVRVNLDGETGYQTVSFNFVAEAEVRLAIRTGFKRNRGKFLIIDDVAITPVATPYDCDAHIGQDYPDDNLVRNGNFNFALCGEDSDGKGDQFIPDWFTQVLGADGMNARFTAVEDPINDGGNVIEIAIAPEELNSEIVDDNSPWMIQMLQWDVPMEPGATYHLSAKVAGSVGSQLNVLVQTQTDYATYGFANVFFENDGAYQTVEYDFVAIDDDAFAQITFHMAFTSNLGATFYIDDVSVLQTAPPPNEEPEDQQVINGSFEDATPGGFSDGKGEQIADGWLVESAEGTSALFSISEDPIYGNGQAMLIAVGSEEDNPRLVEVANNEEYEPWSIQLLQPDIPVIPYYQYELSFRVKGDPGLRMVLNAQAPAPSYSLWTSYTLEFNEDNTDWLYISLPFVAQPDTNSDGTLMNFAVHTGFLQNVGKSVYIDDIQLDLIGDVCADFSECNPGGGGGNEPVERIENGGFEDAEVGTVSDGSEEAPQIATAWNLRAAGTSEASFTVVPNPFTALDNVLQVEVVNSETPENFWDIEVLQTDVPVIRDAVHEVFFSIDGPPGSLVYLFAQAPAPYYTTFGSLQFELDDQPGFETLGFEAVPTEVAEDSDGSVMQLALHFAFEQNHGGTFYLDNLSVKTYATEPPPVEELNPHVLSNTPLHSYTDFPIGTALGVSGSSNAVFGFGELVERRNATVTRHFNSVVAENAMKPEALHPTRNNYNFDTAEEIVQFAEDNNMLMHGHTLIWHSQSPNWMEIFSGTSEEWSTMLQEHVSTIVGFYSGRVTSWDVVNEAFEEDGSLRQSFWSDGFGGAGFIEHAFIAARAADPNADLYYNDYSLSYAGEKLGGVIAMAEGFLARGVPIDGIGLQMHINGFDPTIEQIRETFSSIVALGLKVRISELDLRIADLNSFTELNDQVNAIQQARYREVVAAYLDVVPPSLRGGITVWGTNDSDNWISIIAEQNGFAPEWPMLFDDSMNEKGAFDGFVEGLTGTLPVE